MNTIIAMDSPRMHAAICRKWYPAPQRCNRLNSRALITRASARVREGLFRYSDVATVYTSSGYANNDRYVAVIQSVFLRHNYL